MSFRGALPLAFLISSLTLGSSATADHSPRAPTSAVNALSLEVLGRSLVLGVQFDRRLNPEWALAAGFSRVDAQDGDRKSVASPFLLPIHVLHYFSAGRSAWFASGGLTFFTDARAAAGRAPVIGTLRFPAIPLLLNAGLGFEIRQDHGFLFRVQGLLTRGASAAISTGLQLGYTF